MRDDKVRRDRAHVRRATTRSVGKRAVSLLVLNVWYVYRWTYNNYVFQKFK